MTFLRTLAALLSLLALLSANGAAADKYPDPPLREDIVGTWQGFGESQLEFARLELSSDGTGFLAISYLPNEPSLLYRVEIWNIRGHTIEVRVAPIDKSAELVTVSSAQLGVNALDITLRGATWSRQFVLVNDRASERRATEAKARIRQYREAH